MAAVSAAAAADLAEQLGNLVFPGFLAATAYAHLVQLPRYLRAAQVRTSALRTNPARDEPGRATILRYATSRSLCARIGRRVQCSMARGPRFPLSG